MMATMKYMIVSAVIVTVICVFVVWNYGGIYKARNLRKVKQTRPIPLSKSPVFTLAAKSNHYNNHWESSKKSLTVVTAYIDVSDVTRTGSKTHSPLDDYKEWSEPYRYLFNPLMLYTDSLMFGKFIIKLRNETGLLTTVVILDKKSLWTFNIEPKIKALYHNRQYSKLYAKAKGSEHTSVALSKFTILADAIKRKSYTTTYFCWMDVDNLSYLKGRKNNFWLEIPSKFEESKLGVTVVYNSDLARVGAKTIITKDLVWISGSMYIGLPVTILKFEKQFHRAVLRYLARDIAGTDKQIIHIMYSKKERKKFPVDVFLQYFMPASKRKYHSSRQGNYLGQLMYKPEITHAYKKNIKKLIYFDT